jgi:hypothetical protein
MTSKRKSMYDLIPNSKKIPTRPFGGRILSFDNNDRTFSKKSPKISSVRTPKSSRHSLVLDDSFSDSEIPKISSVRTPKSSRHSLVLDDSFSDSQTMSFDDILMETQNDAHVDYTSEYEIYEDLSRRVQGFVENDFIDMQTFRELEGFILEEIRKHPYYEYCTLLELMYCKIVQYDYDDVFSGGRFGSYFEKDRFVVEPYDFHTGVDRIAMWQQLVQNPDFDFTAVLPYERLYYYKADPWVGSLFMGKIMTYSLNRYMQSHRDELKRNKTFPLLDGYSLITKCSVNTFSVNKKLMDVFVSYIVRLDINDYFGCITTYSFSITGGHMILLIMRVKKLETSIGMQLFFVENNSLEGLTPDKYMYDIRADLKYELQTYNELSSYEIVVLNSGYANPKPSLNFAGSNGFENYGYCAAISYLFSLLLMQFFTNNMFPDNRSGIMGIFHQMHGFAHEMQEKRNENDDTSLWYLFLKNFTTNRLLDVLKIIAEKKGITLMETMLPILRSNETTPTSDYSSQTRDIMKRTFDKRTENKEGEIFDESYNHPKNNYYYLFLKSLNYEFLQTIVGISLINDNEDENRITPKRIELYVPSRVNMDYFVPEPMNDEKYMKWKEFWMNGPIMEFVPLRMNPSKLILENEGMRHVNTQTGLETLYKRFIIHGFSTTVILNHVNLRSAYL